MEDQHADDAWKAGSDNPILGILDPPEPEPPSLHELGLQAMELGRKIANYAWQAERVVGDDLREQYSRKASRAIAQMHDLDEALDRLDKSAEQLAGEHGVGRTLKEGGQ